VKTYYPPTGENHLLIIPLKRGRKNLPQHVRNTRKLIMGIGHWLPFSLATGGGITGHSDTGYLYAMTGYPQGATLATHCLATQLGKVRIIL
jgi:hypothetical protein